MSPNGRGELRLATSKGPLSRSALGPELCRCLLWSSGTIDPGSEGLTRLARSVECRKVELARQEVPVSQSHVPSLWEIAAADVSLIFTWDFRAFKNTFAAEELYCRDAQCIESRTLLCCFTLLELHRLTLLISCFLECNQFSYAARSRLSRRPCSHSTVRLALYRDPSRSPPAKADCIGNVPANSAPAD